MNHPVTHTPFVSQSVFWKSILIVAGLLLGMGVVFAVASNWQNLSRTDKFTILQSTIVASAALTLFVRSARVAGALLLILCIGAIWAFFGQTFQTGVDSWQLFALWSALALVVALAVRHDAVWSLWMVITLIALRLWQYSYESHTFFGCYGSTAEHLNAYQFITTLVPWAAATGMFVYLSRSVLNNTSESSLTIARKIALLGTLSFVVPKLMEIGFGMFGSNSSCGGVSAIIFVMLGLSLLVGLAWFSRTYFGRNDMGYGLALFSLWLFVMSVLARNMIDGGASGVLIFSLMAMASLAVIGWHLLAARSEDASTHQKSRAVAQKISEDSNARLSISLQIMMVFGAFVCTVLFVSAIVFLFRTTDTIALASLAVVFTIISVVVNRQSEQSFVYQFSIPLILASAGFVLAAAGSANLSLPMIFGLIALGSLGLLAVCQGVLVLRFLGVLCVLNLLLAISWSHYRDFNSDGGWFIWWCTLALSLPWACARWLLSTVHLNSDNMREKWSLFLEGVISALLVQWVLLCGDSFLLSSVVPMNALNIVDSSNFGASKTQWMASAVCVLAAGLVFWHTVKLQFKSNEHTDAKPLALLAFVALALTLIALSKLSVTIGVLVLIAALLVYFNQRLLVYFSLLCLLWALGSLYYATDLSLFAKSIWMVAIALGFLLAYVLAKWQKLFTTRTDKVALSSDAISTRWLWLGVLGSTALCLGFLNWNIHSKETVIAHGRAIYIPLAPVDPRSIMAGDYMRLGWSVPESVSMWDKQVFPWVDPRPSVVVALDDKGIAQVPGVLSTADTVLAPNEIKIKLSFVNGNWVYVTNGYYFAEGQSEAYARAKFGEFRVMPDGTALLVGLSDEHLAKIQK